MLCSVKIIAMFIEAWNYFSFAINLIACTNVKLKLFVTLFANRSGQKTLEIDNLARYPITFIYDAKYENLLLSSVIF